MLDLNSLLIGSDDPQRLVDYYRRLFGEPTMSDGGYTSWQLGSGLLSIGAHDQVHGKNAHPGRIIWNLETADVRGTFDRFLAAGAIVVREPYGFDDDPTGGLIATLADPDDNYFQLMSPMSPPSES